MKFPHRRKFLHLAAGAVALPVLPHIARAQRYPTRPVRIILGVPAGGAADIVARLTGQRLSERLGQAFVIENRPGGGGNIATEAVVRALPDGHTLLLVNPTNAINATLYEKLNFNFLRDIIPVASVFHAPNVMVINPLVPAKSVPDFIDYAKANPAKINMASPGVGTSPHLAGELFKMMAGINMIHVPYRTPPVADLIAGQVQVSFSTVPAAIEYIKTGKVRALAVTDAARLDVLSDIPTVGDFLPGYEASAFYGIGAPKNMPTEIVDTLNKEINAALGDPKIKARLADLGGTVISGSPADFGKLVAVETEKWAKVVKFSGAKAE